MENKLLKEELERAKKELEYNTLHGNLDLVEGYTKYVEHLENKVKEATPNGN